MSAVHPLQTGFRPALLTDLKDIMRIECAAYQYPWSRQFIAGCLSNPYFFSTCVERCGVIGYGIMCCSLQEAHILNLCIHPVWQYRGQGSRLLNHLLEVAGRHRCSIAWLEARAGNHAARQFYQKSGFVRFGKRRNYYPAGKKREHAIVYIRSLESNAGR